MSALTARAGPGITARATKESQSQPVTAVFERLVRAGHEDAFESGIKALLAEASKFAGYLGATVERPASPARDYRIVVFFTDDPSRIAWMASNDRHSHLAALDKHIEGPTRVAVRPGRLAWLTRTQGEADVPRYKLAVVRWIALFPLVTGLSWATQPLLAELPLPLQTLVLTTSLVMLTTWVVMPRMMRAFRGWLFPRQR